MVAKSTNQYGDIIVTQRVIAEFAGHIATSCYGIIGMGSKSEGLVSLLFGDDITKGIEVNGVNGEIELTMHIIVLYGINIRSACESVVHRVKYNIETYLGIKVKNVLVKVDGIKVED